MAGLLDFLDADIRAKYEAEKLAEQQKRNAAADRIAALYRCKQADALAWLDKDDADAIDMATQRLESNSGGPGIYH